MVEPGHEKLSVRTQCELLAVNRSRVYYEPAEESAENLELMRRMDELYLEDPTMGARRFAWVLSRERGQKYNRKRIRRLMRVMGLEPIYPRKRLSIPDGEAKRYPYLLRGVQIERPNQVWCADITYIPMAHGSFYLVAVLDWYSRKVLSWQISNSLDTDFCLQALEAAIASTGIKPEIFNTDQGCQFTSEKWTQRLKDHGIAISMDGKARWVDNVIIERFWRSLKYEDIYIRDYQNGWDLQAGVGRFVDRYNNWRPHRTHDGLTPSDVYNNKERKTA